MPRAHQAARAGRARPPGRARRALRHPPKGEVTLVVAAARGARRRRRARRRAGRAGGGRRHAASGGAGVAAHRPAPEPPLSGAHEALTTSLPELDPAGGADLTAVELVQPARRPQKTHAIVRLADSTIDSPRTLISSGSRTSIPNLRRISTGITIRPSSSTLRTTPPARVDAALPRAPAPCLITLIVTLAISLGWSPRMSIDAFLAICQRAGPICRFPLQLPFTTSTPTRTSGTRIQPWPRTCSPGTTASAARTVFFLTGTDEHGAKVAQAAAQAGLSPKEFCDLVSARFRDLVERLEASNDFFIRTTDREHERRVQDFMVRLRDPGSSTRTPTRASTAPAASSSTRSRSSSSPATSARSTRPRSSRSRRRTGSSACPPSGRSCSSCMTATPSTSCPAPATTRPAR